MKYNVFFDYSALALLLVIFVLFINMRDIRSQKLNLVGMMISTSIVATVLDLITIFVDASPGRVSLITDYLLNSLYLMAVSIMPVCYYMFVYVISRKNASIKLHEIFRNFSLYAGIVGLLVANAFIPCVFYFDEKGWYTHGPLFGVLYGIDLIYVLAAVFMVFRYRAIMTSMQKYTIFFYTIAIILCILVESVQPQVMVTQFCEALACMLILYIIENPADYKNKGMDILNLTAFTEYFNSKSATEKHFVIMGIRIDGVMNILELLGRSASGQVLEDVAKILRGIGGARHTFYLGACDFCFVGEYTKDDLSKLEEKIRQAFKKPCTVVDSQIRLDVALCTIEYPSSVRTVDDAFSLINCALDEAEKIQNHTIVDVGAEIVAKGKRESYIVQRLKTAIVERSFEVYYQPIYDAEEHRITRAEALVRLKDEELGYISPDEFIPIAEKKGMIIELGALIFRNVCEMLSREKTWLRGIERVDVNLSAVQCMNETMADSLINIMDAYEIPYKAINFEITETAAVVSEEVLKRNMEKLLDKGVNFSMDDFGCGYSNIVTIIQYPFSVIKLDKSMLWQAMKEPNAMTALKHTIAMFDEVGYEIITEGVETKEMADMLQKLGCCLHQGYYYSRPVPEAEFIKIMNEGALNGQSV